MITNEDRDFGAGKALELLECLEDGRNLPDFLLGAITVLMTAAIDFAPTEESTIGLLMQCAMNAKEMSCKNDKK